MFLLAYHTRWKGICSTLISILTVHKLEGYQFVFVIIGPNLVWESIGRRPEGGGQSGIWMVIHSPFDVA